MALSEGENYIFFPKANYMEVGNMEGAFNGRSCLIGTKDYLFVVPDEWHEFGNKTARQMSFGAIKEGEKTGDKIAAMIHGCESVEELERKSMELLEGQEAKRVLKISDLDGFKVIGGLMGQCRFKRTDGKKCSLVAMGGGNKKRFKQFYAN